MNVAILGGTGKLGQGLALRLQSTSHRTAIGSREISKAREFVNSARIGAEAMTNLEAAQWCDTAIITVPYSAHQSLLAPLRSQLRSKIVIDATVPLDFNNLFRVITESGNSAAQETNALLDEAFVFAAFQTISFRILRQPDHVEDVLLAGPSERKAEVIQFIGDLGLRPIDAGPLEAAALLERMTALLISINRQNKVKDSGLKVTGV